MTANEFVAAYVQRGECKCGLCFDSKPNPHLRQPKAYPDNLFTRPVKLHEGDNQEEHKGE